MNLLILCYAAFVKNFWILANVTNQDLKLLKVIACTLSNIYIKKKDVYYA